MSEVNTPRLMAAAKEFNIGTSTLVDFLVSKGFSSDELKPTSKLSEPMYRVLQSEFQQDKAAKQKSYRHFFSVILAKHTLSKDYHNAYQGQQEFVNYFLTQQRSVVNATLSMLG